MSATPSRRSKLPRRIVVGLAVAAIVSGALQLYLDGSEFEAAARDTIRSDETVRSRIGELLELRKKWLGGERFDSVGDEWSAKYEFRATGTRGTADVSIELEGTGSRPTSYRGRLIDEDGRAFPIGGVE